MRIRELRKRKKLTQKDLGDIIGAAESTVSLYETGRRTPDLDTLSRLADFFGVSVDYLLGRESDSTPEDQKPSNDIMDFNTRIWRSKMPIAEQDQPIQLQSTAKDIKAARYKECREKKGLSQQFVADSLGVPVDAVAAWEDGTAAPDMEQIGALASLYHIDLRYFLGVPGKWEFVELPGKPETNDIRHMIVDELDRQLLEQFRLLSDEKKRAVLALLQTDHPVDQKKGEV